MRRAAGVVGLLVLGLGTARAQPYPPVEDRDFALDLYTGAALGSVRIVGMGGTSVAVSEGTAGTLMNPAAAAVRLTTSKGSWDYDFHIDALRAVYASDFDNDGFEQDDTFGAQIQSFGIAGMLHGWGLAVVGVTASAPLEGAGGEPLEVSTATAKVALAKELFDQEWTVGAAVRIGTFDLARERGRTLFSLGGGGAEFGGLWRQPGGDLRVGASIAFPFSGSEPDDEGCDPLDCEGYILPGRVVVPWQVATGVAWRRAGTRWNQSIKSYWRDERALLLAFDLVLTGAVDDGHGLGAWARQQLEPSGRRVSISPRAGAEYEWIPGRLRVRGGSYWEPGRFAQIGGRVHATFGVEVSLFQFNLWSWRYRVRISATGDVASKYGNAGLSVGFWH
jgi:hypothetical protein